MAAPERKVSFVGPYALEQRLGASGGTEVWTARKNDDNTVVALKIVRDSTHNPLANFHHELQAAQALEHPGLVHIHEFGPSEKGFFLACELIHGPSLAVLLPRLAVKRNPLSAAIVAHIGLSVADALAYALAEANLDGLSIRLVHRHVSPHDLLIDPSGRVVLTDLGVPANDVIPGERAVPLRGKPGYLAPEQVRDGVADPRSDVFSLAVVLHECATLTPLFASPDAQASLEAVATRDPRLLSDLILGFPLSLAKVIHKALAKDPAERYESAAAFASALREVLSAIPGSAEAQAALAGMVSANFKPGSFQTPRTSSRLAEPDAERTAISHAPAEPRPSLGDLQKRSVPPPLTTDPGSRRSIPGASTDPGTKRNSRAPSLLTLAQSASLDSEETQDPASEEPTGALALGGPTPNEADVLESIGEVTQNAPPDFLAAIAPRVEPETSELKPASGTAWPIAMDSAPLAPESVDRVREEVSQKVVTHRSKTTTRAPRSGPSAWLVSLAEMLEDPDRRRPLWIAGGVIILALVLVLVLRGSSSRHDEALRALYEKQAYDQVEAYFVEHSGSFRVPEVAFELAADARSRRLGGPGIPIPGEAEPEASPAAEDEANEIPALPPENDAPAPRPKPTAAPVNDEITVPDEIPEPPATTKADKKVRAKAKKQMQAGQRAQAAGDLVEAEKAFLRCLDAWENAACHLHLAMVYRQIGTEQQVGTHLERYLLLYPNAPQADLIKERIAKARGQR
ncbi:MAG: protein kinase [Myxococcota bacterium]